jgi:DNA-directed RNA polymerase subunit RPC12/RpoP
MPEEPVSPCDTLTFAVSLSPDRDHFLRRACPSCGREFKTEADPAELQWALAAQCKRMGVEIGEQGGDERNAPIRCPFCGHEAGGAEMHTEETVDYLKRLIYREYVLPQRVRRARAVPGSRQSSGWWHVLNFAELQALALAASASPVPRSGARRL